MKYFHIPLLLLFTQNKTLIALLTQKLSAVSGIFFQLSSRYIGAFSAFPGPCNLSYIENNLETS